MFSPKYLKRLFETLKLDNFSLKAIDVSGLKFDIDTFTKFRDFIFKRGFIRSVSMKEVIDLSEKNVGLERVV